jgi:hypothetical protein
VGAAPAGEDGEHPVAQARVGAAGRRVPEAGEHPLEQHDEVRDGEMVCYDGYMDPIALARLPGRTAGLAAALTRA